MTCIPNFGLPVMQVQINGMIGSSLNHDTVKSGVFQGRRKKPPAWLSPIARLIGERALMQMRDWPETGKPVGMPVKKVSVFSGASGSQPGRVNFKI